MTLRPEFTLLWGTIIIIISMSTRWYSTLSNYITIALNILCLISVRDSEFPGIIVFLGTWVVFRAIICWSSIWCTLFCWAGRRCILSWLFCWLIMFWLLLLSLWLFRLVVCFFVTISKPFIFWLDIWHFTSILFLPHCISLLLTFLCIWWLWLRLLWLPLWLM